MKVLGVHIGHDSSSSLIIDNQIIADVSEERYVRIKHYAGLPINSINFCLNAGKISFDEIDYIAISSEITDPKLRILFNLTDEKFNQIITNNLPQISFSKRVKSVIKNKITYHESPPLYMSFFNLALKTKVIKVDHHLSHASSAFCTSGFQDCLIITCDGVGDNTSVAIWKGCEGNLKEIKKYDTSGSFGWFYSLVTEALGWWVGDGEGKTMGLAPYGERKVVLDKEVLVNYLPGYQNGEITKGVDFGNVKYFKEFDAFHWHFPDAIKIKKVVQDYGAENVAAEAQHLLEESLLNFIRYWVKKENARNLATSGGVFLNVKLNQKIIEDNIVENYYIFPNAGDAGLALGAALYISQNFSKENTTQKIGRIYWGPEYSNDEIESILKERNLRYRKSDNISQEAAKALAEQKIIGWFQGKMESGPRALGGRSILFDPRKPENKDIINMRVKFREPFRPFCPSIMEEYAHEYLSTNYKDRYMITACNVKDEKRNVIPAVTHVDGTCRPQLISRQINKRFWELLDNFRQYTGVPVILNTSFNIKGEPIVCSPRDAIKCFFDTGLDLLCIGDFIVTKH
jgi:carbamoyltransferase